jgi:hypothetical protein
MGWRYYNADECWIISLDEKTPVCPAASTLRPDQPRPFPPPPKGVRSYYYFDTDKWAVDVKYDQLVTFADIEQVAPPLTEFKDLDYPLPVPTPEDLSTE